MLTESGHILPCTNAKKTYYNANSAETNFMQLDKCMHFPTEQDWISEEESAVNINWLCYL